MTTALAPRSIQSPIYWAVARAMTSAQFDAYAVGVSSVDAKPAGGTVTEVGTVTLANGQRRPAEYLIGSFTGRAFLSYRTPGGRWVRASAAVEASFVANEARA